MLFAHPGTIAVVVVAEIIPQIHTDTHSYRICDPVYTHYAHCSVTFYGSVCMCVHLNVNLEYNELVPFVVKRTKKRIVEQSK